MRAPTSHHLPALDRLAAPLPSDGGSENSIHRRASDGALCYAISGLLDFVSLAKMLPPSCLADPGQLGIPRRACRWIFRAMVAPNPPRLVTIRVRSLPVLRVW